MRHKKHSKDLLDIYHLLYQEFGPQHWWPGETRLEIIVGAILTQNTAWGNVEKAIKNLKKAKVLHRKKLFLISKKRLSALIRPAGYFNVKAERLKNFLDFLNIRYNGSINRMFRTRLEKLRKELLEVKGIGPETADSILLYAGEKPIFVVDAYTKRIFSRHGYISKDVDYHQAQDLFSSNLPPKVKLFNEYHALIVALGKNLCKTKTPMCNMCPIRRIKNV